MYNACCFYTLSSLVETSGERNPTSSSSNRHELLLHFVAGGGGGRDDMARYVQEFYNSFSSNLKNACRPWNGKIFVDNRFYDYFPLGSAGRLLSRELKLPSVCELPITVTTTLLLLLAARSGHDVAHLYFATRCLT